MPLPQTTTADTGKRSFLRDTAYEMLFSAIQSGQLAPGEVLRDEELMDWLGMSRTPIRSALLRLAGYGLVEMAAGRQTTVAELSPSRTNRALSVSAVFNEYAIRRVVGRLTAAQRDALEAARLEIKAAAAADDPPRLARAVSASFGVLCAATDNRVLDEQVARIDIELARFLQPTAADIDRPSMLSAVDRVLTAALDQDREAAIAAVRALYEPTRVNFLAQYRDPEIH